MPTAGSSSSARVRRRRRAQPRGKWRAAFSSIRSLTYDGFRPGSGIRDPRLEFRASSPESPDMDDQDLYSTIGEEGFTRLIAAFYRQVPGDEMLGRMYPPHDLA